MLSVHEIEFKDCGVYWIGLDTIYFFQHKSPSKFYRAISNAFRFTKSSGFVFSICIYYHVISCKNTCCLCSAFHNVCALLPLFFVVKFLECRFMALQC